MNWKKLLPVIGIVLFIFILFQLDFTQIKGIFSNIHPFYAILSFFVFIPLLLLVNIEWQLLLKRQRIHVSFWYSIKNFFIGYYYGFITPGGLGAITRSLYLSNQSKEPLPKCFSNIVTFNTIEYLALLLLGFVGAFFLSSIYPFLFIFIFFMVIFVIFLYILFFKWSKSQHLFQKIVTHRLLSKITSTFQHSIESFHKDVPTLKDAFIPFILSLTGWTMKYIMLFFIAQLFGISIPLFYFILIVAVADVFSSIPISIYGLGTREAALITMVSVPRFTNGIVISAEQIVSLSLFWYVIIWLIPSIIGAVVTFHETPKLFPFKLDRENCECFEQYMKKYSNLYQELASIVNHYAKQVNHPVILDLGVGPGLLIQQLNQSIPNARIIGIDPSQQMLNQSKKNADAELKIGSADNIPLENNSTDVIVTRYTLTYWNDINKGFQEINRVLKPGGYFIIECLNKDFSKFSLLFIKLQMLIKKSSWSVAQYHIDAYKTAYRIDTVLNLFNQNGFEIMRKEYKKNDWRFLVVGKKK